MDGRPKTNCWLALAVFPGGNDLSPDADPLGDLFDLEAEFEPSLPEMLSQGAGLVWTSLWQGYLSLEP